MYGGNTTLPFSEHQGVDHPVSLYAANKKANELLAHTYSHLYGLPATGLLFFTVYGPWGRPDMALFLFTRLILAGEPIQVFNNSEMVRDFTYVDNIVESLIRVLDKPAAPDPDFDPTRPDPASSWAPHRVFNIGNSNPTPLLDYIGAIESALGVTAAKQLLPIQPGDVPATAADTAALEAWTGFKPNTPVKQSVMMNRTEQQPKSTISLLLGIWGHLRRRRRIQLGMLLVVMLASGLAELVSLGAVLPFLAVLSDPNRLWQQPLIQELVAGAGFTNPNQLILPASASFALAAVLAAMIRSFNLWLNCKLAAAVGSDLSCDAYRRTLYQPYGVHVRRNSSEVITSVTTQIDRSVVALTLLLQLITSSIVATGLLIGLLLIDSAVAIGTAGLFGMVYFLLAVTTRRQLLQNSNRIAIALREQMKALQEGLGAIRDVLLEGSQEIYLEIYRKADCPQRTLQAENIYLGAFPRFAFEALSLVGIAVLGSMLLIHRGSGGAVIPLLGALALGAQRLLPSLQQIYASWAALEGYNADLSGVFALLQQPLPLQGDACDALEFHQSIKLESVRFSYGPQLPDILQGVNMQIRCGERIGLIGSTGSGKSTMVDVLMGLLVPTEGKLLVDGLDVHDRSYPGRLSAWRMGIAHVPQNIYLADSTIAENIAFGIPKQQIDLERVKQAAIKAKIASFIEGNPEGYDAVVGERGVRLSGGQRQRIGIARALYKRAKILVLDEATSALDNATEQAVMDAVEGLSRDLTIVMIAHRLSTVSRCDRVLNLEFGSLIF